MIQPLCNHTVDGLLCTECYNSLQREVDARRVLSNLGFISIGPERRKTIQSDTFETKAGYKRVPLNGVRFDLIPAIALRCLSAIYAEGAVKYGDTNWQNGSLAKSTGDILNHAYNHLTLYQSGDRTEDHIAKVMWGMAALLYFEEKEKNV